MKIGNIVIVKGIWKFKGYDNSNSNIGIIISILDENWALIDFGSSSATLIRGSFEILE